MKFANYFLSRKHTHLLKDVSCLLQVLNTMTSSTVGRSTLLEYHILIVYIADFCNSDTQTSRMYRVAESVWQVLFWQKYLLSSYTSSQNL